MTEFELDCCITRIAKGDRESLHTLYDGCRQAVYLYAFSILRDAGPAEDIVQEVFLKIWANAQGYHSGTCPMAWIFTITRNEAVTCLRKKKRETASSLDEEDFGSAPPPDDRVLQKLSVEEALSSLCADDRQIIVAHILGGLTFGAIGHLIGMPLPTVAFRYSKAVKRLRQLL